MSKFLLHLKRMSNQRQPNEIVYYTPPAPTPPAPLYTIPHQVAPNCGIKE